MRIAPGAFPTPLARSGHRGRSTDGGACGAQALLRDRRPGGATLRRSRKESSATRPAASRRGCPWSTGTAVWRSLAAAAVPERAVARGQLSGRNLRPVDLSGLLRRPPALRGPLDETGTLEPRLVDFLEGLELEADRRRDPLDPQSRSSSDEKFHCLTVHEVETPLVDAQTLRSLAHVGHSDDWCRLELRHVAGPLEEADRQPGRSPSAARD